LLGGQRDTIGSAVLDLLPPVGLRGDGDALVEGGVILAYDSRWIYRFCAQWLLKYTVVETFPSPQEMLIFWPLGDLQAADLRCTAASAIEVRLVAMKTGTIMTAMPMTRANVRILSMIASLRSVICAV
jgi:hypothetical protein